MQKRLGHVCVESYWEMGQVLIKALLGMLEGMSTELIDQPSAQNSMEYTDFLYVFISKNVSKKEIKTYRSWSFRRGKEKGFSGARSTNTYRPLIVAKCHFQGVRD